MLESFWMSTEAEDGDTQAVDIGRPASRKTGLVIILHHSQSCARHLQSLRATDGKRFRPRCEAECMATGRSAVGKRYIVNVHS